LGTILESKVHENIENSKNVDINCCCPNPLFSNFPNYKFLFSYVNFQKTKDISLCSKNNEIEHILIHVGGNFTTQLTLTITQLLFTGFFVTDNESMHDFASQVLKVSLNGLSLTVISFTIVFLFHGVGGGLFCGTVLFR
jgi:hypothetical protein